VGGRESLGGRGEAKRRKKTWEVLKKEEENFGVHVSCSNGTGRTTKQGVHRDAAGLGKDVLFVSPAIT